MERKQFEIEICANSVESCIAAQEGGADRVELCMGIPEGGTTPSHGEIRVARRVLATTRLHVIIRNRGGDFLYTPLELERMAIDIDICKQLGIDGVVFGCLKSDGTIDVEANGMLMAHARGMSVTFHRAFDRCSNPKQALEDIVSLGFDRILTSGQMATAAEGIPLLKELNVQAAGRIKLMAGCGVNEENIAAIQQSTGLTNFHFSAREPQYSRMAYYNPNVFMGEKGATEDVAMVTTARRVRNTIAQLL